MKNKKITKNTLILQGNKTYFPLEVDGVIYWTNSLAVEPKFPQIVVESNTQGEYSLFQLDNINDLDSRMQFPIFAQSKAVLKDIPVINLETFVEELATAKFPSFKNIFDGISILRKQAFIEGYMACFNTNYTRHEMQKALSTAYMIIEEGGNITTEEILEELKHEEFLRIEVDENFKIISF